MQSVFSGADPWRSLGRHRRLHRHDHRRPFRSRLCRICAQDLYSEVLHRSDHRSDRPSLRSHHLSDRQKKIARIAALAALGGLIFNTIFDPLVGYFYNLLILGKPAAELTLAWNITATAINTVISTIVSVLVYMALLPALKKSGLFFQVGKEGSSK